MGTGKKGRIGGVLEHAATVAVIAAAASVIWRFTADSFVWRSRAAATPTPAITLPTSPLSLNSAKLRGSPTAPVVLLLFSEFECPFCKKLFRDVLPTLD